MTATELSSDMRACIDHCLACHKACTETASHVMHGGSHHSESKHLVALLDCAQMCLTHADFMARRSPHHASLAEACANICKDCADLCSEHADKDGMMKQCADACRQSEQSCRQMAMAGPGAHQGAGGMAQGTGAVAAPTGSSGTGTAPEQGTGSGMTQMT